MTKILLVEDDKSLREIYGVRLLAEGYDIVSAGDGEEALAMAIKERPQLIVSDVMMPKISGFDMLDILRSTTETKDIKVIMMTALSSEDQRQRGESLGADRYLVKSQVGIEDVVRTVHEVLGDAPVVGATGNVFAQPPRAAIPVQPVAPVSPSSQPRGPQPATPLQQPAPSFQAPVTPAPTAAPAPTVVPQPASAPQAPAGQGSNLPQPTAPFSTNRPAGLGDRIIHPIDQPTAKTDFGSLMAQELGAPSAPPAQPIAAPAPVASAQPSTPPQAPATPPIAFEETPLSKPPQQPPVAPSI